MEYVVGKQSFNVGAAAFGGRVAAYDEVLVDLGTGDGRFVREAAAAAPGCLAIGIDLCREQMRRHSRTAPANALFVVANALALPPELTGVATRLTINFPWAELLRALASGDRGLLAGIVDLIDPARGAEVLIRLNGAALIAAGGIEIGQMTRSLTAVGFTRPAIRPLAQNELLGVPTSWAKRLAFGRDPRAWEMRVVHRPVVTITTQPEPEFVSAMTAW